MAVNMLQYKTLTVNNNSICRPVAEFGDEDQHDGNTLVYFDTDVIHQHCIAGNCFNTLKKATLLA